MKILLQLVLIVALVLGARFGIQQFAAHAPEVPPKEERVFVPEVEVRTLTRATRDLVVEAQGRVVVPPRLTLTPEVAGRVLAFHPDLEEGARLPAGAELVRIDPADFELALEAAEVASATAAANTLAATAQLDVARAAVLAAEAALSAEEVQAEVAIADWRELNEGEPPALVARTPQREAAVGQLEGARAQVAVAEASLTAAATAEASAAVTVAQAELALARTTVTMPLDGRVVTRSVELGQRVDPMTPLVTVQRDGWPEVRLSVPLDQLPHLDLTLDGTGVQDLVAELTAVLGDGGERRWLARGRAVRPELDERNPVLHVLATTAPVPGQTATPPPPGLFLRARLAGRTGQDVVPVPRRAVQPDGRLLLAVDGPDGTTVLERRAVEVLQRTRDEVLVRAGLAGGERLILTPPPVVQDGMTLTTRPEGAAPATGPDDAATGGDEG